jgi:hypothetical protein
VPELVVIDIVGAEIGINGSAVSQIVGNGSIDLLEGEDRETVSNAFGRETFEKAIDNRIQ